MRESNHACLALLACTKQGVVGGKKTFIMIEKANAHHVTIDVPKGDYSAVDTDNVDLEKYPGLRDVPWWRAVVEPGSCAY